VIFGVSALHKFDGSSIQQSTQTDWRASFVEAPGTFANHKTTEWDTQAVTVQYFQGSATMTSYLVPGSPYMTFQYTGATPLLTSMNGGIASFNGKTLAVGASCTIAFLLCGVAYTDVRAASVTGTEFAVIDTTGTTYIIYALSSITLKATSVSTTVGQIQASSALTGVIRLAQLGQPSYKTTLDQYSATYPTALALDYSYASSTNAITFTWNVVGTASQLLMLTWPHHRAALISPNYLSTTSLSYLTTKGPMYPALGHVWKMQYRMPGITWNPPRALGSSCNAAVLQGLIYEIGLLNVANAWGMLADHAWAR
jgi:endo-1,3(4)-beta-glucanase